MKMKKYKSIKRITDIQFGFVTILKEAKFEVYRQESTLFGLIKWWEYSMTYTYDPKKFLNVIESNY